MSISLYVYVGPYFTVPKDFPWYDFDSLVCEGRGEVGNEAEMILVPNCNLPGIKRQTQFSRDSETPVVPISRDEIGAECNAFARAAVDVISYCNRNRIDIREGWGVVPRWY